MIYHPRNDIYHCCFRLLSILKSYNQPISIEKIRIIDFYLVYPNFVKEITLPRKNGNTKLKNKYAKMTPPFEIMPNKKILFSELKDFQYSAISLLRAKCLIELKEKTITKASDYCLLPDNFFKENNILNDENQVQLINCLSSIELTGAQGLKQRTGLMEYRYDSV